MRLFCVKEYWRFSPKYWDKITFNHHETHYFATSSPIFEGFINKLLRDNLGIYIIKMSTVPKKTILTFNVEIPKSQIEIVACETLGSKATN